MKHIVDTTEEVPYMCEACKHHIKGGISCKAFDIIPLEIIEAGAESHDHVMQGQRGNFVFEPKQPRDTMRIYELVDE